MKRFGTCCFIIAVIIMALGLAGANPQAAMAAKVKKDSKVEKLPAANAAFDANKMGDMSDYDPSNPVVPTGDTIKIAVVASFSGPSTINGQIDWNCSSMGSP